MKSKPFVYSASTVVLAAALALAARETRAQTAPAPPAASPAGPEAATVGEVVVTAQRRSERQVDVPISVAAFSVQQLERRNVTSDTQLQSLTPGLRMDQTGIFVVPTIRGIGTPVTSSGVSPTAIYIDGIYQQDAAGGLFDLNNVSSVQVLKGPQGTLFGRNSEGGAILITTLDPTSTPSIRASASFGNYNERKVNLYLSGPLIGDTLTANIDAYARHNDGYLTNIFTGSKRDGELNDFELTGKLRWAPNDRTYFILKLAHNDIADAAAANYVALVDPATGAGYAAANAIPGAIVATSPYTTASDQPPRNRVLQDAASLKSYFDFGWAALTSYTSFIRDHDTEVVDQDASNKVLSEFHWHIQEQSEQQEFNLAGHSFGGKLDWVTGLYLAHDWSYDPAFYAQGGAPGALFNLNTATSLLKDTAYAVYGDATYNILPDLYITLGARYSIEKKSVAIWNSQTTPSENGRSLSNDYYSFTPRASIRYKINPNSDVYFTYSDGYKSGLFNTTIALTVVRPETLTAYEVGYKAAYARWNFEAAAFYYQYNDLQFQNTIAGVGAVTSNAGNAVSYGGEANLAYAVNDRLSLDLAVAYTHAHYTSFKGAVIAIPCSGAVLPPTPTYPANTVPPLPTTGACKGLDRGEVIVTENVSGSEMIRAPEWTISFGPDYRLPTSIGTFELSANLYASSRVFFQADDAPYFSQGPYAVLDLKGSWSPDERFKVSLWANNATNAKYLNQASPDATAARIRYAAPAEFGVTFSYKN